jgi:hypothetical protein|tara:strand:- start:9045 stop:9371 length:327 start_codon:yes stop_codon:yes gene_type:complete
MAKILETKLPFASGELSSETFNRLVRVLELSLGKVDIDSTNSVNETQRNENKFQDGDIIWNLSTSQIQLWNGKQWVDIYTGTEKGVQGTSGLGKLTVSTNGAMEVPIL